MTTSVVNRKANSLRLSNSLIAFDMVPLIPDDVGTFDMVLLYVETGGTIVFDVLVDAVVMTRTVTVPDFYITPFAVSNVRTASTATGIHALVM